MMNKINNMQEQGGYTIEVKPENKTIDMVIVGAFTPEQAEQFHKDYNQQVTSVAANDFVLKVDCSDMKVINQDMVPALTHSFELYKSSGFNKIEFIINTNAILKMQLNRIARNVGLPNYEVIEQ